MISFKHSGNFDNTEHFCKRVLNRDYLRVLNACGQQGVVALEAMTPKDTGKTASCWTYKISRLRNVTYLSWSNTNILDGAPIAIMLQYGYGTRSGAYVEGRDYINPAMAEVMDKIADTLWQEVINL